MAKLNNIIIHCSDSAFGNANLIRQWHKERGWRDIGYHFVILNGQLSPDFYLSALVGSIECGRYLKGALFIKDNEIGAHTLGYNRDSIGVCFIGKEKFSLKQYTSGLLFVQNLMDYFKIPVEKVLGHCETSKGRGKTCPNIDMWIFREDLKQRR